MLEDFEKLCSKIFYYKNKFQFPFEAIIHEEEFQYILKNDNYPILKKKMENLIELINKDRDKLYEDTKILWDLI